MTTDPDRLVPLIAVERRLLDHVMDLLQTAGVTPSTADPVPAGESETSTHPIAILVPLTQWDRAAATIDLVFPGMRPPTAGGTGGRLSERLVRRGDWPQPQSPAPPAASSEAQPSPISGIDPSIDDYIPPPPPPLPQTDAITRAAWLAAISGPLLLVISAVFSLGATASGIGLTAFLCGFGVLVARMPNRAPQDDGWDDGAVV